MALIEAAEAAAVRRVAWQQGVAQVTAGQTAGWLDQLGYPSRPG
jgi:hypothetical protein